jgi:hypothetical protein
VQILSPIKGKHYVKGNCSAEYLDKRRWKNLKNLKNLKLVAEPFELLSSHSDRMI